jgi:hypothetical protein
VGSVDRRYPPFICIARPPNHRAHRHPIIGGAFASSISIASRPVSVLITTRVSRYASMPTLCPNASGSHAHRSVHIVWPSAGVARLVHSATTVVFYGAPDAVIEWTASRRFGNGRNNR